VLGAENSEKKTNLWVVWALTRTLLVARGLAAPSPRRGGSSKRELLLSTFGLDFRPFGPHWAVYSVFISPPMLRVWIKHWVGPSFQDN